MHIFINSHFTSNNFMQIYMGNNKIRKYLFLKFINLLQSLIKIFNNEYLMYISVLKLHKPDAFHF